MGAIGESVAPVVTRDALARARLRASLVPDLLVEARRAELAGWAKRLGWSYTVNHTDRLASDALVRVHAAMTADSSYAGGARA